MKRLLLIDGSNMLFRAYYAIPAHLSTSTGQPTNAVFGFVTMLNKLIGRKVPDFAAVVFDPPGGSFRQRESADYKSNRESMPGDLASQLRLIDRAVECFQFPILRIADFEADDVIATIAKRSEALGHQVIIVSGDKDFSQLLSDNVSMFDGMREIMYDPELVRKKFGVSPHLFVDYQALCGDKIDNIPGVPGIGSKTASKLLEDFGSLDAILARLDEVKGKAGALIAEHRETALLSRRLAQLDSNVDLEIDWDKFAYRSPDQSVLNDLFSELEFFSLLKAGDKDQARADHDQKSLRILNDPSELADLATESSAWAVHLMAVHRGFEFETVGLSLAEVGADEVIYAPFDDSWSKAWADFFTSFGGDLIAHDVKEIFRFFLQHGITSEAMFHDTRTTSYLVDPAKGMPHDLDRVAKLRLQRVLPPLEELTGKGKSLRPLGQVPLSELATFSASYAKAVAELHLALADEVASMDIADLAAREVTLSRVLARMEVVGIKVDRPGLEELSVEFRQKLATLQASVFALAGREFNVGSPKQLAEVLFEELKLPVLKKTKTGYSTDAEVLEKLAKDHEVCRTLLEYRKFEKLITTYVDVLLRDIHPRTGRVHTTFGQTVSTTGRLITSEPDLQRTPVKTDEGKRIRKLFQAGPGRQLLVADWSQIELRVLAHLCGDPNLVDAFSRNLDVHRRTAGEIFGKAPEEVTKSEREIAKTVNFATIYGQGASALAQNLGIAKKEAEAVIAKYFQAYKGVRDWLDSTMDLARVTGKVKTLAGRTRMIPELYSKNFAVLQAGERMAVNTPVQGSAADICKAVMIAIDEQLQSRPHLKSQMLLQIHDELIFECPEAEIEEMTELVRDQMEHAWELKVPLLVSIGHGPSWEDAKA
jgi:DNA polymerase-1